jgi:hypothetical protein
VRVDLWEKGDCGFHHMDTYHATLMRACLHDLLPWVQNVGYTYRDVRVDVLPLYERGFMELKMGHWGQITPEGLAFLNRYDGVE